MLDPANDLLPPPSSPTISSVSSSDLDTESTGSFFHDRSTTLGTLMGVTFPASPFRAPSLSHSQNRQLQQAATSGSVNGGRKNKKNKAVAMAAEENVRRRWRRRRWWRLCRDDCDCRPSSLGEFLEVERRFGDGAFFGGAAVELERVGGVHMQPTDGRVLFADGRVLPPAEADNAESAAGGLCRFSVVSLGGICSGGGGRGGGCRIGYL